MTERQLRLLENLKRWHKCTDFIKDYYSHETNLGSFGLGDEVDFDVEQEKKNENSGAW